MIACLAIVATSWADTVVVTGTTTGAPTWKRPVANAANPPTSLSGFGTNVPYSVQQFSVGSAGTYVFQSTANFDNYTFLYQNSFNPLSQLTNVLIGNDDNPSIGLSGFSLNLVAGTQYFFITTGFANTDFGAFSNNFSGPGTITLGGSPSAVPENGPGMLLFGLAAAGLIVVRRKVSTAIN